MKFIAILALFGGIEAIKLHSHQLHNSAQVQLHQQVASMMQAKRDVDLSEEQEKEVEAWVEEKLTTGDKEISKKEAKKGLEEFVKKHKMPKITDEEWDELDKIFNEVDANGNGKLSYGELKAAWEAHEKDMESAFVQVKSMIRSKRDVELSKDQEEEIEAWVKDKLSTGDKQISKKEAKKGLEEFVKKHKMPKITDEEWDELDKIFNEVDANGNGKLSYGELKAAWEAHEKDMESAFVQVKSMIRSKRDVELSKDQEEEIEAWVKDKLSTGDKQISKKEAKKGLEEFVKKHKMPKITEEEWDELDKIFNEVDTNGNGKIDVDELKAAIEHHEKEMESAFIQVKSMLGAKRDMELTEEQEEEIKDWIEEKLTTGDEEISKKEAKDGILAFAKKHEIPPPTKKEWKELEKIFDEVDTNDNGKIDGEELKAAWEHHQKEMKEEALLQIRSLTKSKRDMELTKEQEEEIVDWIEEKLSTGDNEISKDEAKDGILAFAKKHEIPPPSKEEWKELEKIFDEVDTNDNGKIDGKELEAAWKAHQKEMKKEEAFLQVKSMLGAKRDMELTKEQEEEIKDWIEEKLTTGDEEISKKEAKDGILAFAKKHEIPPPTKKEWKELEKIFDEVDTNDNGKIDGKELQAAWEHHEKEMAKEE